jgi:tRNA 5-methylaminomethyl-2-thiouridine biosynthesis bifunctional protein
MPAPLAKPDLEWRDGAPWSRTHGDWYASRSGARAEREHVFLRGNGFAAADDSAPGRWHEHKHERARLTFGELGFGAGITFLCAWAALRRHAAPDAQLDWVSVEHAPLDPADVRRAALGDPAMAELLPLVDALCAALPPRVPGIHRRALDGGRVRLTLLWGDVLELLPEVEFAADAWCLDGFAPARNEAMWSEAAVAQVAAHSRAGTSVATYAAASAVGERLAAAGCEVRRVPGANGKREMIVATVVGAKADAGARAGLQAERSPDRPTTIRTLPPWFAIPAPCTDARHALVIGAGLAGASAARALAERDLAVTVLDAHGPASGASAAPRAVLAPHLASWQSPQTRIVSHAFLHARATLARIGAPFDPCGLLHPVPADDAWGFEQAIADWGWPPELLRVTEAADAALRAGTELVDRASPLGALWVAHAGVTRPADSVRALLAHPAIEVVAQASVAQLVRAAGGWRAVTEDARAFEAPVAVVATAGVPGGTIEGMPEPLASDALPSVPFDCTRGQLSMLAFEGAGDLPRAVVSANGFVMPPVDGVACTGATFERERLGAPASPHDDAVNLGHAERLVPVLATHAPARRGAWAGLRTAVHDHCPVAGPVVEHAAFSSAFARLAHGPLASAWPAAPVLPGLFATLAHGSRGTCTAMLAGELVADMVSGSPRCVGNALLPAVLPQRFLVRDLRAAR